MGNCCKIKNQYIIYIQAGQLFTAQINTNYPPPQAFAVVKDSIYQDIKKQKKQIFSDKQFPKNSQLLSEICSLAYFEWRRISQILKKPKFVLNGFGVEDIAKGQKSLNYTLSIMAALAQYPEKIKRIFPQFELETVDPNSIYRVRLMDHGAIRQVVLDDFVPVSSYGNPLFSRARNGQFWHMILEKGIAKIMGGYNQILKGDVIKILRAISFSYVDTLQVTIQNQERLFQQLDVYLKKQYVLCARSGRSIDYLLKSDIFVTVVGLEHVLPLKERVIKLRYLLGDQKIWEGKYSFMTSHQQTSLKGFAIFKDYKNYVNFKGYFLMPWLQFCRRFKYVLYAINQTLSHNHLRVEAVQNKANQFLISLNKPGMVIIGVYQLPSIRNAQQEALPVRIVAAKPKKLEDKLSEQTYLASTYSKSGTQTFLKFWTQFSDIIVEVKVGCKLRQQCHYNLTVDSNKFAYITKIDKYYPNFLASVFTQHALRQVYIQSKYLYKSNKNYFLISKLLLKEAGLGYIYLYAVREQKVRVQMKIASQSLVSQGFRVKGPLKKQQMIKVQRADSGMLLIVKSSDSQLSTLPPFEVRQF